MNTLEHLTAVLPPVGPYCYQWFAPDTKAIKGTLYVDTLEELTKEVLHRDNQGFTVYFRTCNYKERKGSSGTENAKHRRSFHVDVDVGPGKDYTDRKTAANELMRAIKELGLTKPLIVDSGYGFHAYWLLNEDITIADWTPTAKKLKADMMNVGLKIDAKLTANPVCLLRPIGTHNRKAEPKPVKLLSNHVTPISHAEFAAHLGHEVIVDPLANIPIVANMFAPSTDLTVEPDYPPSDADAVAKHCNFIKEFKETGFGGGQKEPLWYDAIGGTKHCVDGEAKCHEFSSVADNYGDGSYCQEKIDKWGERGPTTCEHIRDNYPEYCKSCEHKGKITSPIHLGVSEDDNQTWKELQQKRDKDALITDYVYLKESNQYYSPVDDSFLKPEALDRTYKLKFPGGKDTPKASAVFDSHPDKVVVSSAGWLPTDDKIITLGRKKLINTYPGLAIAPAEGSAAPFLKLVSHIYGQYTELVLDYFAFMIQYPEKKCTWQLLVVGHPRTGKSLSIRPLKRILGPSCKVITDEALNNGWGDYYVGTKLLVVEEIYQPGGKLTTFNTLKPRLSNDDIEVLNIKGGALITQQNLSATILFTNHDDALAFNQNEDKLLVIGAPSAPLYADDKEKSEEFYSKYANWAVSDAGAGAVLHFLQQRDISSFKYGRLPVRTTALERMCSESRPDYQQAIVDMVEHKEFPFSNEYFRFESVRKELKENGYFKFSNNGIKSTLESAGYIPVRGQESTGTRQKTPTFWTRNDSSLAKASQSERFEILNPTVVTLIGNRIRGK